MECIMCGKSLKGSEVNHIAITVGGDPVLLCDQCYEKVRIFFEEVKHHGKTQSRRSYARSQ